MIYCCITTFNPDIKRLSCCLSSINCQVDKLFVIDNCSENRNEINSICQLYEATCILLESNVGIAEAQNIVWRQSIKEGVEFIVFSDQDTVFPHNSIASLAAVLISHPTCAAVAPVFRDKNSTKPIEVSVNIFEYCSQLTLEATQSRVVSHVISSGMIVRNNIASIIGLNREDLFIDWVDTEWCWRARLAGYDIIQIGAVVLEHVLGEDRILIGKKQLTRHKLFRGYYKIRNAIILIREIKHLRIRIHLIGHTIKNIFLAFFSIGSVSEKLKLIYRATWDGFCKKGGIYE